jgi:hypothetical protein
MPETTLPNGITIASAPRSRDYDFAARAASELDEVEKHALISYLMLSIAESEEGADGETLFCVMDEARGLLGMQIVSVGPEDLVEQAGLMGVELSPKDLAEITASEAWRQLPNRLGPYGAADLQAMIRQHCQGSKA